MTVELSTLGSVIKTAYEAEADTNAYTDAEKTKLAGVEAAADVTDTANVTAAGALMDSEVTNLAQVKAFDSSDYATAAHTHEGTAILSTGELGGTKFLREDGDGTCSWQSVPGAGGDLLADGTVPLTADWDVGSFDITAAQFHSDIATGTAPFTVASTTVVTNLNADTVDGSHASAFATSAQGALADSALQNVSEDTTPTLGGDLDANGQNVTNLGDVTFQTGAAGGTLRTGTSAADKFQLQAYDVDGAAYVTLLEADAGNDVRLQLPVNYLDLEDATDTTKIARLSSASITTGTTRTYTFPDASGTFALADNIEGTAIKSTGEAGGTKFLREDGDGTCSWQTVAGGSSAASDLTWSGGTQSEVSDGASAVAFNFDTDVAYSTSGAKLASWKNNGTEQVFIGYGGDIWRAPDGTANRSALQITDDGTDPYISTPAFWLALAVGSSQKFRIGSSVVQIQPAGSTIKGVVFGSAYAEVLDYDAAFTIRGHSRTVDEARQNLIIEGGNQLSSATTNLDGGDIIVRGGAGASGSAGDADGGNVYVRGGAAYGTGSTGLIIMDNLPTSDPGVAGALWNNSNVLNVSAG